MSLYIHEWVSAFGYSIEFFGRSLIARGHESSLIHNQKRLRGEDVIQFTGAATYSQTGRDDKGRW